MVSAKGSFLASLQWIVMYSYMSQMAHLAQTFCAIWELHITILSFLLRFVRCEIGQIGQIGLDIVGWQMGCGLD
jgi:hypothetical protein